MTALCRVCLTDCGALGLKISNIFERKTISEIIENVMCVSLTDVNGAPDHICGSCLNSLQISYELKLIFENTQEKLLKQSLSHILLQEDDNKTVYIEEINQLDLKKFIDEDHFEENQIIVVDGNEPLPQEYVNNILKNLFESRKIVKEDKVFSLDVKEEVVDNQTSDLSENDSLEIADITEIKIEDREVIYFKNDDIDNDSINGDCSKENKEEHQIKQLEEVRFACSVCNKTYSRQSCLEKHLLNHKQVSTEVKPLEGNNVFSNNLRELHEKKDTGLDCNKIGSSNKHVGVQRKNESKNEGTVRKRSKINRLCQVCGHISKTSGGARYHIVTHEGKHEKCNLCSKKFFTKFQLKCHIKGAHLDEVPMQLCVICGKGFKSTPALQYHLKIHANAKDFPCSYCDMKFYQQSALKTHLRRHTGVKKFKCDICPKGFCTTSELKKHIMVHNGIRPFVCKYCPRGFTSPYNLRTHSVVHRGNVVCGLCDKGFMDNDILLFHMRAKHRISFMKRGSEVTMNLMQEEVEEEDLEDEEALPMDRSGRN